MFCLLFLTEHFSHQNISKCLTAYIFGISILLGSSALASLTHNSTQQDTISPHSPIQPSFNCLTTEASCVFSRETIEVASQDLDLVFRPIAQRIKRATGSFLRRQGFKNMTAPRQPQMDTRETLPSPSENHTFPVSFDINSVLGTLENFTTQNLKIGPVTDDRYLNGTDRELSVRSVSTPVCIQEINESTPASNISSFGPHINKGCFEEFLGSHVSSKEWNCFYRQQLCVA